MSKPHPRKTNPHSKASFYHIGKIYHSLYEHMLDFSEQILANVKKTPENINGLASELMQKVFNGLVSGGNISPEEHKMLSSVLACNADEVNRRLQESLKQKSIQGTQAGKTFYAMRALCSRIFQEKKKLRSTKNRKKAHAHLIKTFWKQHTASNQTHHSPIDQVVHTLAKNCLSAISLS